MIDDLVEMVAGGFLTGLEIVNKSWNVLEGYKSIKFLQKNGWSLSLNEIPWKDMGTFKKIKCWAKVCDNMKESVKFFKYFDGMVDFLECVALVLDCGFSLYSIIAAAQGTDLSAFALNKFMLITTMEYYFTCILFGIGAIPYVGWIISAIIEILDIIFGISSKLASWLTGLFCKVKSKVTTDVEVVDNPDIAEDDPTLTVTDFDENGLDVGDRIEYWSLLKGKIQGKQGHFKKLVSKSYILPYYTIHVPAGSSSKKEYFHTTVISTPMGNLTLPIPPENSWSKESNAFAGTRAQTYEAGGWIEPGMAMPNFPMKISLDAVYKLWYEWEHFVFLVFYAFWCQHLDYQAGQMHGKDNDMMKVYLDVMPGNIHDFMSWVHIVPQDRDRDGLSAAEEYGFSDPYKYDTDGDGLSDGFEKDINTSPKFMDTDGDCIYDWYEVHLGTDATNSDTDSDGVLDFQEISGLIIEIKFGACQDPIKFRAYSDPCSPDSDSDGVDDFTEYLCNLNPKSKDSNGDGEMDNGDVIPTIIEPAGYWEEPAIECPGAIAMGSNGYLYIIDTELYYVTMIDTIHTSMIGDIISSHHEVWDYEDFGMPTSIDVDSYGKVYIGDLYNLSGSGNGCVHVFDENGDLLNKWEIGPPHEEWQPACIAISKVSDKLYSTGHGFYNGLIFETTLDGTLENIKGKEGTGELEFKYISDLEMDDELFLYVADLQPYPYDYRRIQKINYDGWELDNLISEQLNPLSVQCDQENNVYVLYRKLGHPESCLKKYNSNCQLLAEYDGLGKYAMALEVGPDGYIYVLDLVVKRFEQIMGQVEIVDDDLDSDGDGLYNDTENEGWNILFTDENGTHSLKVTSDPRLVDTDLDGLSDFIEHEIGSNPRSMDTDNDGRYDYLEYGVDVTKRTDPTHFDSDGDGLDDSGESAFRSNPMMADTDGDGLTDAEEWDLHSDPNHTDSDRDGLPDGDEKAFHSSLISPDADNDFMFDGLEFALGTNPNNRDTDGDGLDDGDEFNRGTEPLEGDTDEDGVLDGLEVAMYLDPLRGDTDNDGILDGAELKNGTNPFRGDSDLDGIPDNLDEDSTAPQVSDLILAYDPSHEAAEFIDQLEDLTSVEIVTVDQLLSQYTSYPRIVLVGKPGSSGPVGALVGDLLSDTGRFVNDMIESDDNRMITRHGVWTGTQTVVMLSKPYPMDELIVLDALRRKTVSIEPDWAEVEFNMSLATHGHGSVDHVFMVDEVDTIKQTDAVIAADLEDSASPIVEMSRYNDQTTPFPLNAQTGLNPRDIALGKYLDVIMDQPSHDLVETTSIRIHYKESDLDRTGDGDDDDPQDINETTLVMYGLDQASGQWVKMDKTLDWVHDTGVDTKDVELWGTKYSGCVHASTSHFTAFALASSTAMKPLVVENFDQTMKVSTGGKK
ncbi:MAG: NHL repeat-containing protein [Planctomycetota bacterium]